MHNIVASKLNNNDESCVLVEWFFETGQHVEQGQTVALLETSKAVFDLHIAEPGILYQIVEPGTECQVGTTIGYIFADEAEQHTFLSQQLQVKQSASPSRTITKAALELIEQHGITETQIQALGKTVIKKSDIEELLGRQEAHPTLGVRLSRRQAAIADTVRRSHMTIPTAFSVMKIYCDNALQLLRQITEAEDILIGLTELLVKSIADLHSTFPFFFGRMVDDQHVMPAVEPNVGVTIDAGSGLFIPVVKEPRLKSLTEIADHLMDFRIKALRDKFLEEDLTGGDITISLSSDEGIILTMPIILPPQTCMLSLGSVQQELTFDTDSIIVTKSYVYLGLVYDHRVINGYEAVQFLSAIKTRFESPEGVL